MFSAIRPASPPQSAEARLHVTADVLLVGQLDELPDRGAKHRVLLDPSDRRTCLPSRSPGRLSPTKTRTCEPERRAAVIGVAALVRAPPSVTVATPGLPRRPAVAVGHADRALLVTHRDVAHSPARPSSERGCRSHPPRTPKMTSVSLGDQGLRHRLIALHQAAASIARNAPASKIRPRISPPLISSIALLLRPRWRRAGSTSSTICVYSPLRRQRTQRVPPAQIARGVVGENQALGIALRTHARRTLELGLEVQQVVEPEPVHAQVRAGAQELSEVFDVARVSTVADDHVPEIDALFPGRSAAAPDPPWLRRRCA